MYINGNWVDSSNGDTFKSINPATGEEWAEIPNASESDVNLAVESAHKAFSEGPWSKLTASDRGQMLRRLASLIEKNSELLGRCETTDTGKLFKETRWQANYISKFFEYYAGLADKVCGETLPIDKPNMLAMTIREPLGVVAAVVPWNSQLFLVAVKVGPALAAGNAVVLKASEHASAPMLEFAKIFAEAGFPPGVLNIVTGFGEPCGRALTSHPLIDRVSFTGGPETARNVIRNTAENFAEVSLELGGKSPVIVFEDTHIQNAINGILLSIFSASGQSCVAGSRLILHESIKEKVLNQVIEKASQIRIGNPMDENSQMGPLATKSQLTKIESTIDESIKKGAEVMYGGNRPKNSGNGWFIQPTIINCPNQSLPIVQNELFGPILSVLTFKTEEDALFLANDSNFGLASGIFTQNIGRALRISKGIRAGIVWVNTYRMVSPLAPFGGFKDSGYGRESGMQAIYDYTKPKTVWLNTSPDPIDDPFVMQ